MARNVRGRMRTMARKTIRTTRGAARGSMRGARKSARKSRTGQSMKYSEWKKDRLVRKARQMGIKAPTTKTKPQLIREIKRNE